MKQRTVPLEVTNKAILKIAVPMAAGFLTTPLVGIADTAIVGQLGNPALIGGVAVASVLIGLLLTTFNFLRSATSALTAQAHGRQDGVEQLGVLLRSCFIALTIGAIVIVLHRPLLEIGLKIIHPSEAVAQAVTDYFLVRIWATPFTLLNFVFLAWLVGIDRPMTSFLLQSFLNLVNIMISYHLVLNLDMGVAGAAWGTVIAEGATVFLTIIFLPKPLKTPLRQLRLLTFDKAQLRVMMVLNIDIMIRSFCLQLAFAFFTRQSAQQSDTILAANEILLHFFMIAGYFLDGFAIAVEQFVGRALGARNRQTFRRSVTLTSLWNFGQAILLSLVFLISSSVMIDFITVSPAVREVAYTYSIWAALTPVVGVAAFQMDGIFIGATWSKDMRNSMVFSLIVLVLAYYILFPLFGNHGLWLALWLFMSVRALSLYFKMKKREAEIFNSPNLDDPLR